MGSKDRIQRLKDETRTNILDAAIQIAKAEGWPALSMRKIAEVIEYTAPIIYEYFENKDAILFEVTKSGFVLLLKDLQEAKSKHPLPAQQLEAMWLAYWNFAFAERELYQLMFGVEVVCCVMQKAEFEAPSRLISSVIQELLIPEKRTDEIICRKYYTCWSVVHGLISINIVRKGTSDDINQQILRDAITGIIKSIND